jgi:tetratricopeptide (TPR) repeat protein
MREGIKMRPKSNPSTRPRQNWTSREAYMLAVICLVSGMVLGYVVRGPSTAPAAPAALGGASASANNPFASVLAATPGAMPQLPTGNADVQAAPLLAALTTNPQNVEILIQLGNLYNDNHQDRKAIEYYQRALDLRPDDVNVRTDMGTSYWYSGDPQKAVAEYKKSLSINPTHPQTLFNLGVVLAGGLKDNAGAVAAWSKLLQTNPDYPDRARVLNLIADAKKKP